MKKLLVYLDNCCFNRPFDDQTQLRIKLETEAKLGIQLFVMNGKINLVWSYILNFENEQNPYEDRKTSIKKWIKHASMIMKETDGIVERAQYLVKQGLKSKDALHISCAIDAKCDYFITTDDEIIKKMENHNEIMAINPLNFIQIYKE